MKPDAKIALFRPVTASDGIHDKLVTRFRCTIVPPRRLDRPRVVGSSPTVRTRRPAAEGAIRCGGGGAGTRRCCRPGPLSGRALRAPRSVSWIGSRSSWPTTTSSCGRACGPCSVSRTISRSSGSRPTTTSWSPGPTRPSPQVVVTDIRMPPNFQNEGIEAAKVVRKLHPGTGVVILSQYDEPEYAISLLAEGAAGYAYLLKDRVSDGNRLARAIREVATGGSMLDPEIVAALVSPVRGEGELTAGRGPPARAGRRRSSGEGHRVEHADDARGGERRHRGALPDAGPRGQRRTGERVAPPAPAAEGDPRPGGAGRDAQPPAARAVWPRSCAPTGAPSTAPTG